MAAASALELARRIEADLLGRNPIFEAFFEREAPLLAAVCRRMSERFARGGRLLAFGRSACATDAQHVSVEFVHPVIVGKRALPALDLSASFPAWIEAIAGPDDMVMGFAPPEGDPAVARALASAAARGAMTFALPGTQGDYAVEAATSDPFVQQELLEILYHTLWETVHVFFEHIEPREHSALGDDAGAAGFLYPFLGAAQEAGVDVEEQVAASIREKVRDDAALRERVAREQAPAIAAAAQSIADRIGRGGQLILFGNGGSATDANDLAIDCVAPPSGLTPVPAVSLALEPANVTAIANDVGTDVIFLRQLIAQARPHDVAVAISTSGGSRNIVAALEEARRRGLLTVALLGCGGGEIVQRGLADRPIVVPSDYIPRIQEVQASIYHAMRRALEAVGGARRMDGPTDIPRSGAPAS